MEEDCCYRLRVWQKNNDAAWTSPVFFKNRPGAGREEGGLTGWQEIVNVRIDDRLIHGQVAAVWSQYTKATRIMVVDDQVVHDVVNKEALKMACPQQCKLSILTAEKAAANLCAGKYDGEKVFIVAKNPKTIRSILDHGVCDGFRQCGQYGR